MYSLTLDAPCDDGSQSRALIVGTATENVHKNDRHDRKPLKERIMTIGGGDGEVNDEHDSSLTGMLTSTGLGLVAVGDKGMGKSRLPTVPATYIHAERDEWYRVSRTPEYARLVFLK